MHARIIRSKKLYVFLVDFCSGWQMTSCMKWVPLPQLGPYFLAYKPNGRAAKKWRLEIPVRDKISISPFGEAAGSGLNCDCSLLLVLAVACDRQLWLLVLPRSGFVCARPLVCWGRIMLLKWSRVFARLQAASWPRLMIMVISFALGPINRKLANKRTRDQFGMLQARYLASTPLKAINCQYCKQASI